MCIHINLSLILTFSDLYFLQVLLSKNIFDGLPALSALVPRELHDELDRYLSADPENVSGKEVFAWWYER